ncbi:hypothetical protein NDA13_004321 [Ustilago tritici]|nr:hypothetical protein NDA13_004321 [Ustilago tritici]
MIYEVAAAVEHIVNLIQETKREQQVAPEALAGFASTLKDALEKRCQRCWRPAEPELGSAQRSVAWQLHAAGEGADCDLLRAFASVLEAQAEEGEIVHLHQSNVVALALQWLPMPFTLWIDPGCVAVRRGSGPGANRSSYDFDLLKSGSSSSSSSIHVIWGQMVAATAERGNVPQFTVSSAPRPIPIVKPTATVTSAAPLHLRYPVQVMSNPPPQHHHRALSNSSSASSSSVGLVRSVSLSSTHTVFTDATSVSDGLDNADNEATSEACPSLCSPSSSRVSSQCTPSTGNDRDSVHDTTIGDTTVRFAGVRLFSGDDDKDEQEEEEAGDLTIGAAGSMIGLNLSKDAKLQHMLGASPSLTKPLASSTPVKCNYTTHDNGNVGVLGGGVRLGGGGSSKPAQPQPPRHRQHSNSKSISHLQGGLHNQLLPPYMPQQYLAQPIPRQLHYMHAPNYSAPMRTDPLPNVSMAPQQQQHYQPSQYGYQQQQRDNAAMMQPFAHPSQQLPAPYGYRALAPQQQQAYGPRFVAQPVMSSGDLFFDTAEARAGDNDEEADEVGGAGVGGRRRLRSRGRRSRGRGAGRAARRQATALRALELGSTDELPEFADYGEEEEDDDLISRCSTPATSSEYTYSSSTASSSCYSSAISSPAKQQRTRSGRVSHKSSRHNLRAAVNKEEMAQFGMQLHSNLARLQAFA